MQGNNPLTSAPISSLGSNLPISIIASLNASGAFTVDSSYVKITSSDCYEQGDLSAQISVLEKVDANLSGSAISVSDIRIVNTLNFNVYGSSLTSFACLLLNPISAALTASGTTTANITNINVSVLTKDAISTANASVALVMKANATTNGSCTLNSTIQNIRVVSSNLNSTSVFDTTILNLNASSTTANSSSSLTASTLMIQRASATLLQEAYSFIDPIRFTHEVQFNAGISGNPIATVPIGSISERSKTQETAAFLNGVGGVVGILVQDRLSSAEATNSSFADFNCIAIRLGSNASNATSNINFNAYVVHSVASSLNSTSSVAGTAKTLIRVSSILNGQAVSTQTAKQILANTILNGQSFSTLYASPTARRLVSTTLNGSGAINGSIGVCLITNGSLIGTGTIQTDAKTRYNETLNVTGVSSVTLSADIFKYGVLAAMGSSIINANATHKLPEIMPVSCFLEGQCTIKSFPAQPFDIILEGNASSAVRANLTVLPGNDYEQGSGFFGFPASFA